MGGRGGGSPGAKGGAAQSAEMTPAQRVANGLDPYGNLPAQEQIEKIYNDLRPGVPAIQGPEPFIRLADIRDRMSSLPQAQWEEAIRRIAVKPNARVIAIANLKSLSQRDKDAAVKSGGETKHAIAFVRD